MKFYFCETCGKRLTEKDLDSGLGRNKKLKGVFCTACAVGVSTMDSLPLTDEEALEITGSPEAAGKQRVPTDGSPVRKGGDRRSSRKAPAVPPPTPSLNRSLLIGAAVAVLLLGSVFLIFSADSPELQKQKTDSAGTVKPEALPEQPPKKSSVTPEPGGPDRKETVVGTALPPTEAASTAVSTSVWPKARTTVQTLLDKGSLKDAWETLANWKQAHGTRASKEEIAEADALQGQTVEKLKVLISKAGDSAARRDFETATRDLEELKASMPAELADMAGLVKALQEVAARKKEHEETVAREKEAKAKVEAHLDRFTEHALSGSYAQGLEAVKQAVAEKNHPEGAKQIETVKTVAQVLVLREQAGKKALEALVGKIHTLEFKGRRKPVKGKVVRIEDGVMRMEVEGKINNQSVFFKRDLKLSALTPQSHAQIFGRFEPKTGDEWLAKCLIVLAQGDHDGAETALSEAKEHPLVGYYTKRIKSMRILAADAKAQKAWEELLAESAKPLPREQAKAMLMRLDAFRKEHGQTGFVRGQAKAIAEVEGRLAEQVVELKKRLAGIFKGKIVSADARTGVVEVHYDFNHKAQIEDFQRENVGIHTSKHPYHHPRGWTGGNIHSFKGKKGVISSSRFSTQDLSLEAIIRHDRDGALEVKFGANTCYAIRFHKGNCTILNQDGSAPFFSKAGIKGRTRIIHVSGRSITVKGSGKMSLTKDVNWDDVGDKFSFGLEKFFIYSLKIRGMLSSALREELGIRSKE